MGLKSMTARARGFRRAFVAVAVLAALLLGVVALPATSSARTLHAGQTIHVTLPYDGVGDSPPVP
jgi:hypothetical protein